jgi:hypothetical protein
VQRVNDLTILPWTLPVWLWICTVFILLVRMHQLYLHACLNLTQPSGLSLWYGFQSCCLVADWPYSGETQTGLDMPLLEDRALLCCVHAHMYRSLQLLRLLKV